MYCMIGGGVGIVGHLEENPLGQGVGFRERRDVTAKRPRLAADIVRA